MSLVSDLLVAMNVSLVSDLLVAMECESSE